jgi:hypothetical protein
VAQQIAGCAPTPVTSSNCSTSAQRWRQSKCWWFAPGSGEQSRHSPFTPELECTTPGQRGTVAKSTVFINSVNLPCLIAVLSENATMNAGPRPGGATTRLDTGEHQTSVSIPQLRARRDPRERLVSAHRGQLLAPKRPARVLFWSQRRHRPAYPRPGQGLKPSGYDRRSGSSRLGRRCLSPWG